MKLQLPGGLLALLTLLAASLLCACAATRDRGPASSDYEPRELLVRFADGVHDAERDTILAEVGGTILRSYTLVPNLYQVSVTESVPTAIRKLESHPEVLYAHPNYRLYAAADKLPANAGFEKQWGLWVNTMPVVVLPIQGTTWFTPLPYADIEAPAGWDVHTGSGDFVVAVIDSGLRTTADDFEGNLWIKAGKVGWDFVLDDGVTFDTTGHGTRVASIIGGRGVEEGTGQQAPPGVVGVSWNCRLMPLRIIGKAPGAKGEILADSGTTADAIAAIEYAVDFGVRLSNNSYGAKSIADATGLKEAIEKAGQEGDHLFVCAAGNLKEDLGKEPFYPASFDLPNMLVVTSTTPDDQLHASKASYSDEIVDLGAPGKEIFGPGKYVGYGWSSGGTSFATAYVTGAAALIWDRFPDWPHEMVKGRLITSARINPALKGYVTGGRQLELSNLMNGIYVLDIELPLLPPPPGLGGFFELDFEPFHFPPGPPGPPGK